jgi:hypothetical protein
MEGLLYCGGRFFRLGGSVAVFACWVFGGLLRV